MKVPPPQTDTGTVESSSLDTNKGTLTIIVTIVLKQLVRHISEPVFHIGLMQYNE